ncbi:hypothetical protein [Sandaracinus amylolyticus]|uniref:hypothetical protein n=1 Tax=Sandaracinus amylolyticus TaxID=927083 RepID=UPI001F405DF8|nr:hypothetical protein [Sandaracinus amylolyticus]UJR86100.1 Hypothetical protein I5071_81810 [Sandaracinus amylolyticus]
MIRRTVAPGIALVVLMLVGCGQSAEEAACNDTVQVFGDAIVRCGLDEGASRDDLERQIESTVTMTQGCERVVSIRDEAELREECLPALETVACADLSAGTLPPSCRAQIEVEVR